MRRLHRVLIMLALALVTKGMLIAAAYYLPVSFLSLLGLSLEDHSALVAYAPEVWLSLLALVFGTLIIVVSIASENTPRLVDMFVGDPLGRLYIWLIMLSSLENIYLQLVAANPSIFFSNLIFLNNYVLLPLSVLLAIPYTFYILKFTKSTNVIEHIFRENLKTISRSRTAGPAAMERNQLVLFETVNQLHDLLQYTQFKEPKADVIVKLGKSVRIYLKYKRGFAEPFFKLTSKIRDDISFRTLQERYPLIEQDRLFYEQKVLKVLDAIYLLVMNQGHFDLASLCGSELVDIGRAAIRHSDKPVVGAVILNFNTLLRYGINHGLKTREVRNAYNIIFYYNQLIHSFMTRNDAENIVLCCTYLGVYADELTRLRLSEPQLNLLIDAICWELKKNLIYLSDNGFPEVLQRSVLDNLCKLSPLISLLQEGRHSGKSGLSLIKISLCLFYIGKGATPFVNALLESMVRDRGTQQAPAILKSIEDDCEALAKEGEAFWEDTDQGSINIYYSDNMDQIPRLLEYVRMQLEATVSLPAAS